MTGTTSPPFAAQRMICMALVFGMTMYAVVAGVMLQMNDGKGIAEEPIEDLNLISLIVGVAVAIGGTATRLFLAKRVEALPKGERGMLRFIQRLAPIAMIEAGCLLAIIAWMLNGQAVPALVVACVLISIAIAMLPLHDPDVARSQPPG